MRSRKNAIIIMAILAAALSLSGCSSKEEFSAQRAYRDAALQDYEPMIEGGDFYTDGYMMTEDDRKRIFEAYEIVNTIRKDEGLKPLKWDADLEACAIKRAEELPAKFDHVRPNGASWFTVDPVKMLGENIYKGSEHADMVMDSWMKNQPDRENFLYDGFTIAAVALYRDANDQCYWTFEFGSDQAQ